MTEPSNRNTSPNSSLLRRIPKVDLLLSSAEFEALFESHSRTSVIRELRRVLDSLRLGAAEGWLQASDLEVAAICRRVETSLRQTLRPYYQRVINGTGVILHTGLGRAPLATQAVEALQKIGSYPQRLEIDLESGQRGGRDEGCAALLRDLTGCEAATVVNNNAAATLLILALARGQRVVVSRGELVEIGGSYRIPDVMKESGAILTEVGTTNCTHLYDYIGAIDDDLGMILKVHTSNYRVQGFTEEVSIEDLVALGRDHSIPVVYDLGSGCMIDLAAHGCPGEPFIQRSVDLGVDLVCFSGDKLLGGPQAGIILGRKEAVDRCRRHPLFRAIRPGRLVYSALEATLRLYLDGEDTAMRTIPALARITMDPAQLEQRARRLAALLEGIPGLQLRLTPCASQAGSGSMPTREFPSWGVKVVPVSGSTDSFAAALRQGEPPIFGRTHDDALLLDVRTLEDEEFAVIAERLREFEWSHS